MNFNRGGSKYLWTHHALDKMRYYRLAESRIKRIIRHPTRVEEGVLDGAVACMQPAGGKNYSEIWTMYLLVPQGGFLGTILSRHDSLASSGELAKSWTKFSPSGEPSKLRPPLSRKYNVSTALASLTGVRRIKIITAWRYPGKSPEREPVPADILREVRKLIM